MHLRYALPALALVWVSAPLAAGADLRVYPSEIRISGPNRTQQLLVVEEESGRVVRDVTASAKFTPTGKVTVDASGLMSATGAGEFKIAVAVGGKSVAVGGSVS